ncbi:MAG: chemotaxis protein CheB [Bacteroidetes bacterium HGW-Bacteroidetes-11]|jgi:two-component system CheB/CheR fusion protein|nr:MAG: chemotaxis protein CheB [Bacteroidetes bacterium HGW-Bacteroidetes-11]
MKLKKAVIPNEKTNEKNTGLFPIVGIGASAGGLEALEQFLSNVPLNSGMAYIVIQHLDPTQKGFLTELLQRITKMEVHLAEDRMAIAPNCVYVIPPNKSMSILKRRLLLFEPIEARGLRLPIDFFLRSLADDCKELAVGLILSGMGSDGSAGLKSIKENNGIVLIQEPSTAKFDSMPRNAIDSVLPDIVAPANELPARLIEFLKFTPSVISDQAPEIKDKSALEKILILLRLQTGNDFQLYKKNTVYRRIERRMGVHKIEKIITYVHFLQENPKEVEILFKELLIGVTSFFRDPLVWDKMAETIIPDLISKQKNTTTLRAWVPGCSTGEEAYSLAIVFKEALEKLRPSARISLQIFASDLDIEAIETARKGIFPANIISDVSPDRLNRYFNKSEDGYKINTEIREMIVFAQHNLIMHPPFTKMDIVTCRNLLIYLEPELQKKLLGVFYYSLNPGGTLLLGNSETPGSQGSLYNTVDLKLKIFTRTVNSVSPDFLDFPSSFSRSKPSTEHQMPEKSIVNIQTLADQLLLQQFSPAGVLVNENGDIVYISGRTGKYLEPAVGKANLNIFAMLREGLRNEFPAAFRKSIMKREAVELHNIKVGTNGTTHIVNVKIQWIDKPATLRGTIMIIFSDVLEVPKPTSRVKKGQNPSSTREIALEEEVERLRDEIQSTIEEMQTSQEELKSTNEELQSSNEELQSTNEELTTSKEEMQSLNEELQTVNVELQSKVDDFARVNNDMKNLLNSTDIATLFLDKELNIRRFTNQATKIFKLIKSDIGRPFTDQASDLIYPGLVEDALEVLQSLVFIQKQIPTKDGRWFTIRIMPYRTFDDRIDGLVITFINESDFKDVEWRLTKAEKMLTLLFSSSNDILIRLSVEGNILDFNPKAETFFEIRSKEVINLNFIETFIPEPSQKKIEKDLSKRLKEMNDKPFKMQVVNSKGKMVVAEWSLIILHNHLQAPDGMILVAKNE